MIYRFTLLGHRWNPAFRRMRRFDMPLFDRLFGASSRIFVLALATGLTAGCSMSVPRIFTEYKIDVQQGNVLTQDMVAQLRPGLSKDQVRYILGSPMLMDVFHGERWDYVYRLEKGSTGAVESRKFSVFFTDGVLSRVAGDVVAAQAGEAGADAVPSTRQQVVDLGSIPQDGSVQAPPPESERGFFGRMLDKVGL